MGPQNWKFAFMPSPNQKQPNDEFNFYQDDDAKHVNADTNNDSGDDETMSEYPQSSNSNASNIPHSNPMQEANVYSNLQNRQNQSSFIPQTCPNRRKHSPKRHNIESQVQSQSQSETSVSSSDQSQQRMQAHEEINIDDIENGVDSSDIQSDVPISSPSPSVTPNNDDIKMNNDNENKAPNHAKQQMLDEQTKQKQKEKQKRKQQQREENEEIIRQKTAKRIEEMKNDKIKEREESAIKEALRDQIHPRIILRAHPVKNNPISLIKCFYPKSRINADATKKDVLKAFKRALANFHPDRTMNKCLEDQITAEEIFKLLSTEKDKFESQPEYRSRSHSYGHAQNANTNYNPQQQQTYYNNRRRQHGWF